MIECTPKQDVQLFNVFTSCPVANGDLAVCLSVGLSVRKSVLCGCASPPRTVTAAFLLKRH